MKNFNSSILKAKINQQLFRYRFLKVTYLATLKISSQSWGIFKLVKEDLPSVQFLNLIFPTCQLRLRPACLYFRNTRSNVLIESKERETNKLYRNVGQLWTVKLLLYLVAILFFKNGPTPASYVKKCQSIQYSAPGFEPTTFRTWDQDSRPNGYIVCSISCQCDQMTRLFFSMIWWLDYLSVWSDGSIICSIFCQYDLMTRFLYNLLSVWSDG